MLPCGPFSQRPKRLRGYPVYSSKCAGGGTMPKPRPLRPKRVHRDAPQTVARTSMWRNRFDEPVQPECVAPPATSNREARTRRLAAGMGGSGRPVGTSPPPNTRQAASAASDPVEKPGVEMRSELWRAAQKNAPRQGSYRPLHEEYRQSSRPRGTLSVYANCCEVPSCRTGETTPVLHKHRRRNEAERHRCR